MAQASAVIEVLKGELKARNLTYAVVAQRISMSEASVKRMFSTGNFTLERIDAICAAAGSADAARDSVAHLRKYVALLCGVPVPAAKGTRR